MKLKEAFDFVGDYWQRFLIQPSALRNETNKTDLEMQERYAKWLFAGGVWVSKKEAEDFKIFYLTRQNFLVDHMSGPDGNWRADDHGDQLVRVTQTVYAPDMVLTAALTDAGIGLALQSAVFPQHRKVEIMIDQFNYNGEPVDFSVYETIGFNGISRRCDRDSLQMHGTTDQDAVRQIHELGQGRLRERK